MAYRWDFKKDFIGYLTINGNKLSLYSGNGLAIGLHEWTNEKGEEMYSVQTFFADINHLKNYLGISKEYDNTYEGCDITLLLTHNYKKTPNIIQAFAKAKGFKSLKIEVFYDKISS